MEVKVFFNTATDFWRMHLNIDDLYKKYEKKHKDWQLPGKE